MGYKGIPASFPHGVHLRTVTLRLHPISWPTWHPHETTSSPNSASTSNALLSVPGGTETSETSQVHHCLAHRTPLLDIGTPLPGTWNPSSCCRHLMEHICLVQTPHTQAATQTSTGLQEALVCAALGQGTAASSGAACHV